MILEVDAQRFHLLDASAATGVVLLPGLDHTAGKGLRDHAVAWEYSHCATKCLILYPNYAFFVPMADPIRIFRDAESAVAYREIAGLASALLSLFSAKGVRVWP